MQLLGLSESTPKPENRLKSLFWPRVQYLEDVEYLGTQGYWVCIALALFTLFVGASRHNAARILPDVLFFYLAGVGIRRRSRFAAISVFVVYLLSVLTLLVVVHSGGVISVFFLALLLSNMRATWVAHHFVAAEQPVLDTPLPPPTGFRDKFTDTLPRIIWPVGKWLYYVLAPLELVGVTAILFRGSTPSA